MRFCFANLKNTPAEDAVTTTYHLANTYPTYVSANRMSQQITTLVETE